jgi:hypothetical protein
LSQSVTLYNQYFLPAFPQKDAGDSLNYSADFSAQMTLDGDTLASIVSVVPYPADLVINELAVIGNMATFRATGGTQGTLYIIDVIVTTTLGNTFKRGFTLTVLPT